MAVPQRIANWDGRPVVTRRQGSAAPAGGDAFSVGLVTGSRDAGRSIDDAAVVCPVRQGEWG